MRWRKNVRMRVWMERWSRATSLLARSSNSIVQGKVALYFLE